VDIGATIWAMQRDFDDCMQQYLPTLLIFNLASILKHGYQRMLRCEGEKWREREREKDTSKPIEGKRRDFSLLLHMFPLHSNIICMIRSRSRRINLAFVLQLFSVNLDNMSCYWLGFSMSNLAIIGFYQRLRSSLIIFT